MDMDKKKMFFACLMVEFEINYFLEETAEMMWLHLRKQKCIVLLKRPVIHHAQRKIQKGQNKNYRSSRTCPYHDSLNVSQSV